MDVAAINLKNGKKAIADRNQNLSAAAGGDTPLSFSDLLNRANFSFDKGSVMMASGAPFTPKANAADKASEANRPQNADRPQAAKEKAKPEKPKEAKKAEKPEKPENKAEAKNEPKEKPEVKESDNSDNDYSKADSDNTSPAKSAEADKPSETKTNKDDDVKLDDSAMAAAQTVVAQHVIAKDISINLSLNADNEVEAVVADGEAEVVENVELDLQTVQIAKASQAQEEIKQGEDENQTKEDQASQLARMLNPGDKAEIKVQREQAASNLQNNQAIINNAVMAEDEAAQGDGNLNQNFGNSQGNSQQNAQSGQTLAETSLEVAENKAQASNHNQNQVNFAQVMAAQNTANGGGNQAQVETGAKGVQEIGGVNAPSAVSQPSATQQASQTHAAKAPEAPRQPQQAQEVPEQISVNIEKAIAEGKDKINIKLNPESLGSIEVKLELKDGKLTAMITAERPETLEMLQKDSRNLEKSLNEAGFKTENGGLNFGLKGGENQQQQAQEENAKRFAKRGSFEGVLEAESDPLSFAKPWTPSADRNQGVDIRI